KMAAEQREHLKLSPPGAGSIAGRINRKVFAKTSGVSLSSATDPTFQMEIQETEGKDSYDVGSVPAGTYKVELKGPPVADTRVHGAFFEPRVAVATVEVKGGAVTAADFGFGPRAVS